ncbi:acyltransferase domain-containing protein [Streptomyces diastatochromogenes]|nr:acyltransferase domain-containing protein [Streptomyces diastatochromogenes]
MGRSLTASLPAFATTLDACDTAVRQETGRSVRETLDAATDAFPDEVATVQPVLWATQVALAAAWRDMGVDPEMCVGHSMGEVAAAAVTGALCLPDAAAVICRRSTLMQRTAGQGAMMSVDLSPSRPRNSSPTRAASAWRHGTPPPPPCSPGTPPPCGASANGWNARASSTAWYG